MSRLKIDTVKIRQMNRSEIFEYIKKNPYVTRADISRELDLSFPTVTNIVSELTEARVVEEKKSNANTGGRSSMAYICVPNAKVAIGIQLSGRRIKGALVNLTGDIVGKVVIKNIPFEINEMYRRAIGELYQQLLTENQMKEEKVIGVGVTVQGLTDEEGTRIVSSYKLSQHDIRCDELTETIPVRNRLFHDSEAIGYNRKLWTGKNIFYISINSSIGGAILINDQIYLGNGSKAGEIGHMHLHKNGRKCYCGSRGCFDAYCNTLLLKDFAGGELEDFFKRVEQKEERYLAFWREYVENLAEAVYNIRLIFDGIILIGGELGNYSSYYLDEVREILDKEVFFHTDRARDYVFADGEGENAIVIGAAMYYIEKMLEDISETNQQMISEWHN